MGRNTQGVTIFRVADNEHVVCVAKIDESEEEEIELEGGDELAPDDGADDRRGPGAREATRTWRLTSDE